MPQTEPPRRANRRGTSQAMIDAARNRIATSIPLMLAGQQRAKERRAAEALAASLPKPVPDCPFRALYQAEKAKRAARHPDVRGRD